MQLVWLLWCLISAVRWNENGVALQRQRRFQEAERAYQNAIGDWGRAKGPASLEASYPIGNLGSVYFELKRYAKSEDLCTRALEIRRAYLPESSPEVARAEVALAAVYSAQQRYSEAEPLLRGASVADASDRAYRDNNLAVLCYQLGRRAEAIEYLESAVKLLDGAPARDPLLVIRPLENLADLYRESGQSGRAVECLARALRLSPGAEAGTVLRLYAEALKACGRRKEAREADHRARAILKALPHDPLDNVLIDARDAVTSRKNFYSPASSTTCRPPRQGAPGSPAIVWAV